MSLPAFASIDDLAAWLGQEIDDASRADMVLRGASTRVRAFTGRAWMTDVDEFDDADPAIDADDFEVAQTVVLQMAGRVWVNPKGIIHDTTGPYSARWSERVAEGLYLTDEERDMLGRYRTGGRSGLWTLSTTRDDTGSCGDLAVYDDTCYVDVVASEPFPLLPVDW